MHNLIQFFRQLSIGLLILVMPVAYGASASQELASLLDTIKSMQASFKQTVTANSGKVLQRTTGQLTIARPNKFRWVTANPTEQIIIADGKQLWIYDKDLEQVTVKPQQKSLRDSPAAFLSGNAASVLEQYAVKKQNDVFLLTPKGNEAQFQQVSLVFVNQLLKQMNLRDNMGQTTEILFVKMDINNKIGNNVFHFIPPSGVDVIRAQ